jgi:aspartyl-tRNA(Asn)/glutamyl-tRNA(Gln) amidotransferase subunit B
MTAMQTRTDWEPVIGLETHVELGTVSKMFCGCSTTFGAEPNTHTCPVCLALPGALPVVNESAISLAVKIGLALNCQIAHWSRFARKNYFYPDMPKNFQISQYDEPLCFGGYLDVSVTGADGEVQIHRVGITRVHMEEDTGKSLHIGGSDGRIHGATHSLLDYNRAGVPLVEIVTEPDIRSAEVAKAYVTELREVLRALRVSEAKMEQGQMRCDANVSLRPRGVEKFGTRTETKNLNSLRSVERAIAHEIIRQGEVLDGGGKIIQETRHFDEAHGVTQAGRVKEEATDYRYFPEPDLLPVALDDPFIEAIRDALPELPSVRRTRLTAEFGFAPLELEQMVGAGVLDLVEETIAAGAAPDSARAWWLNELARTASERGVEPSELPLTGAQLARVIELVAAGTLTNALARQAIIGVLAGEGTPDQVVASRGLALVEDADALSDACDVAIAGAPDIAEKVRSGKAAAVGPLVGAVMKAMKGSADAAKVRELLLEKLGAA